MAGPKVSTDPPKNPKEPPGTKRCTCNRCPSCGGSK